MGFASLFSALHRIPEHNRWLTVTTPMELVRIMLLLPPVIGSVD
jgi:hypothetical protein